MPIFCIGEVTVFLHPLGFMYGFETNVLNVKRLGQWSLSVGLAQVELFLTPQQTTKTGGGQVLTGS